jgi:putative ABC transport system permease protein
MEFGPILRTLFRNKTRIILISVEVALTLAIVVNCINMVLDMKREMDLPTGMNEPTIITVRSQPFSEDFKEEGYFENSMKVDLDAIRALPGVLAADAFNHFPLSGSGSSSGYKPLGSEMNTLATGFFTTGVQGVDALGVQIVQGRNFTMSDVGVEEDENVLASESRNVLVTKAYADRLFPDGDALGSQIQGRTADNPHTIVGIIGQMHGSWPGWTHIGNVLLFPGKPGDFNWGNRYMVRTDEGATGKLISVIEEKLLELNNNRNVRLETLADVKAETFGPQTAVIKMFGAVIILLVFVTALGIIGITSFAVTERIHHIGTRRALGATQFDILRYFLTENWMITSLGVVLGLVFTYGLNILLVNMVSGATLDWYLPVLGILAMWLIGQVSAFFPALRGARTSPAVATRSV